MQNYNDQKDEIVEMNVCFPKGNVNEHRLFHGTTAAQEIIRNGFSIAKSSNGK